MREILFRGKAIDTKEWAEGAYYHQTEFYGDICDNHYIITSKDELEDNMMIFDEVIPETIGQFTGLYDNTKWKQLTKEEQSEWLKNHTVDEWRGRKIFEGDIVNVCTKPNSISNNYKGRHIVISFDEFHRFVASGELQYPLCPHYEWEVIGNIHDNPELLEVSDNA